ncbi:hypothetical protein C8Q76DRAFT_795363 [Earliella scabrosa]|nr:hypothetical protein C8Q76DRAFT_795363 [Earliella scabrosa]
MAPPPSLDGRSIYARQAATTATCLPEFDWMTNSKNQSPCLVTSWTVVPCQANGWIIGPPEPVGMPYLGPTPWSDLFACQCNTVHYSMVAACAFCQGLAGSKGIVNFTEFKENCPSENIYGADFPEPIPPETAIPAWAYLDLRDDRWDNVAAFNLAAQNPPGSALSQSHSSSSASSTSTSVSTTVSPSATQGRSETAPSKSIVGPVVGGAVGGAVVLLLASVAVVLWLRRRRSRATRIETITAPGSTDHAHSDGHWDSPTKGVLYDPDDPSTFPPAKSHIWATSTADDSSNGSFQGRRELGSYKRKAEIQP